MNIKIKLVYLIYSKDFIVIITLKMIFSLCSESFAMVYSGNLGKPSHVKCINQHLQPLIVHSV